MSIKNIATLFKITFQEWQNDEVPRLAAAFAFYTVFSIAPLLVVVIGIAGLLMGEATTYGKVFDQVRALIGSQGQEILQSAIASIQKNNGSIWATLTGFVTLFIGATSVFAELQADLDRIWKVKPKPGQDLWSFIRNRVLSLGMVLVIGFLLLVSLIVSTILSSVGDYILGISASFQFVLQIVNFVVSFGVITLLFAAIYKYLPDSNVRWYDVWIGASVTSFLFVLGKFVISFYLAKSAIASSFGAAGALILLLLWVYYSSQILFFGAEFTKVQASTRGPGIPPKKYAIKV